MWYNITVNDLSLDKKGKPALEPINYGIDWDKELAEQTEEDHIFGSFSKRNIVQIKQEEREGYFSPGELQNKGEEKMDCATRSGENIGENTLNFLLLNDKLSASNIKFIEQYIVDDRVVLSDAFNATLSGTTRQGNSLKAPLHSIHKQGIIPKAILPQALTFNEHHDRNRITDSMIKLGEESVRRFPFFYERVEEKNYDTAILEDMLDSAGYAWPDEVDGVFHGVDYQPNHAFVRVRKEKTINRAFDNYIDSDGDFFKNLAEDYKFMPYAYRLYLPQVNEVSEPKQYVFFNFDNFFKKLW